MNTHEALRTSSGPTRAEETGPRESGLRQWVRATPLETTLVLGSLAVIALHVLDDNYLQPQPGTSAADHLASGLIPVAILAGVAVAYPLLPTVARAALAMTFGALGLAIGFPGAYHLLHDGISGDDYTALLAIPAGVALLLSGPVLLWRARRTDGSRRRRYLRRTLAAFLGAFAALAIVVFVVFPIGFSYGYTHLGRTG
ncbi:MAG: hypothetical protein ACXW0F_13740, partial [Gaiellaceae bacterium]